MGNGFQAYCIYCDLRRQRTAPRKEQQRRRKTLRKYGITEEQYQEMWLKQNGTCLICKTTKGTDERTGRLSVDHDHLTDKVRGLLCGRCNMAIGLLRDDPTLARRVADYLLGG